MNKRDFIFQQVLGAGAMESGEPSGTPAAFFLHFDPAYQRGQAAVDKHLEFFRFTEMDFVKIQYEKRFPTDASIQRPGDWARAPRLGEDFFAEPLEVVAGLVKAAKAEAPVVMTLYSPFMLAGQVAGADVLTEHLRQDPEAVKAGLEIITQNLLHFVRGCIRLGIDGFYASTQGGESHRFQDKRIFEQYIKPFDLAVWEVITPSCPFNILHVCDYTGGYDDLTPFLDYPGQVVNCSLKLGERELTGQEVSRLFQRPFMGGMERLGVIAHGTAQEVQAAARAALDKSQPAILAADCTVPDHTPWENLKAAINTAHHFK